MSQNNHRAVFQDSALKDSPSDDFYCAVAEAWMELVPSLEELYAMIT